MTVDESMDSQIGSESGSKKKEMVENEIDSKIKCLRSNNGVEFTSKEFMDYCSRHGIKRKFSIARTPQQNGFFEGKN
jgi:transposase InsO family protein